MMFQRTSTRLALAQYFRQMALLATSGIPLHRALEVCGEQTSSPVLRAKSRRISEDLRHGVRLSDALTRAGAPFTPMHSGVILAAENTGRYDEGLEQLALWEEKGDSMERKIRSLVAYPALILSLAFVGTFVLLRFLAPLVRSVMDQVGTEPNLASRIVMFLGDVTSNPWVLLGGALATALALWLGRKALRTRVVQGWWERWSLTLPLVGNLLWKAWLVRVARCLHSLLNAGLPMVRSVELAAEATGNGFLGQHVLKAAAYGMLKGESLSQALPHEMLSRTFVGMLGVGETSGKLPEMLGRLADLYEIELGADIDSLFRATEPLLMGFVGLLVLGCLLTAFQPLYSLIMHL